MVFIFNITALSRFYTALNSPTELHTDFELSRFRNHCLRDDLTRISGEAPSPCLPLLQWPTALSSPHFERGWRTNYSPFTPTFDFIQAA